LLGLRDGYGWNFAFRAFYNFVMLKAKIKSKVRVSPCERYIDTLIIHVEMPVIAFKYDWISNL